MKILFISPYPPMPGGLSSYTQRLVEGLKSKDYHVDVLPFKSWQDLWKILFLNKLHPDIVRLEYNIPSYGISTLPLFLFFLINKYLYGIKFVVNYHEVKRENELFGNMGSWFYKVFSSVFAKIYVHTVEAKQILINKCHISNTKVIVIPHGLIPTFSTVPRNQKLKESYLIEGKKNVLYLGFIHPDKGIEYLLESIKIIAEKNSQLASNLRLTIAGDVRKRSGIFKIFEKKDKQYKESLISKSKKYKLSKIVNFLGYIPENDLYGIIDSADIIVLPYTNTEQSGVLNRVLAFKKPIIASKIGGLMETLNKVGILVRPGNSSEIANEIEKLLLDKKYYRHVSLKYESVVKELSVDKIVSIFIKSLDGINE